MIWLMKNYNIYTNIKCKMKTIGNLPLAALRFQSRGDQQRPKRHAPFLLKSHLWGKLPQVETKYCSTGCHMSYHLWHLLYNLQNLNTQILSCNLHLIPGVAHLQALAHTSAAYMTNICNKSILLYIIVTTNTACISNIILFTLILWK